MSEDEDDKLILSPIKRARRRAEGQCEVLIQFGYQWNRCPGFADDVHHMLPRSRGGLILDKAHEEYHLVVLCRVHHQQIHENPHDAEVRSLTIEGRVMTDKLTGRPRYIGPDRYLSRKYGDEPEEPAGDELADYATPRPLAGVARRRPAS